MHRETTIVRSIRLVPTGRLGSPAMFVILLTAFGVLCSYFPGKIPPQTVQQSIYKWAECHASHGVACKFGERVTQR